MYGWLTFYHQGLDIHYKHNSIILNVFYTIGHEVAKEFKSIITDLQIRLQRVRFNLLIRKDYHVFKNIKFKNIFYSRQEQITKQHRMKRNH